MRNPVHKLPKRILEMFSESTYIRGISQKGNYSYAVPVDSPEEAFNEMLKTIKKVDAILNTEEQVA